MYKSLVKKFFIFGVLMIALVAANMNIDSGKSTIGLMIVFAVLSFVAVIIEAFIEIMLGNTLREYDAYDDDHPISLWLIGAKRLKRWAAISFPIAIIFVVVTPLVSIAYSVFVYVLKSIAIA